MDIIWTIIIGLAAGIVAKFVLLGSRTEPSDFVTTAILGILGAMVATFLGRTLGWYEPGQGDRCRSRGHSCVAGLGIFCSQARRDPTQVEGSDTSTYVPAGDVGSGSLVHDAVHVIISCNATACGKDRRNGENIVLIGSKRVAPRATQLGIVVTFCYILASASIALASVASGLLLQ